MNSTPLFSTGTASEFKDFLRANNYPVNRKGDDLSIPNRLIIRQVDPEYPSKLLEQLKTGENVPVFITNDQVEPTPNHGLKRLFFPFIRLFKIFTRKKKGPFNIRLIQLCQCCGYFLIEITGNQSLIDALQEGAIIRPGEDTNPRGASLEIVSSDSYVVPQSDSSGKQEKFQLTPPLKHGEEKEKFGHLSSECQAVRVAVIDTGFRFANLPADTSPITIWHNPNTNSSYSPCGMQDDLVGWNFVGVDKISGMTLSVTTGGITNESGNNNPDDDNSGEHGTLLSAIITQTTHLFHKKPCQPEIMVLKAFDSYGVGTLFTIICAMCYAKEHGADVINASFVAYLSPSSSGTSLLRQTIKKLEVAKIMVVCAAGNRHSAQDTSGIELGNDIFPACFSNEFQNVITVTSVWDKGNGRENYSSKYVNVGVVANHINHVNPARVGFFDAPYLWYRDGLTRYHNDVLAGLIPADPELDADLLRGGIDRTVGSSFATAYVTGLVAAVLQNHGGIVTFPPPGSVITSFRDNLLQAIRTKFGLDPGWVIPPGGPHVVKNDYYVQL